MKLSDFMRELENGHMPEQPDSMMPYWAGWLTGASLKGENNNHELAAAKAIEVVEFIESHARDAR